MDRKDFTYAEESIPVPYIGEPYTMANPPSAVKNLPKGAQSAFISAFNSVYARTKDETKARMAGWGAVKNKYKKVGNKWVKK